VSKNIIDSLFLELGIDTAKFSADQAKTLALIQKFEAQAKKSGRNSGDAIKTVGKAFEDLAKNSKIGASASAVDSLAKKITALGQSARLAGGVGAPLGMMAEGLGMLLSPAALGVAAVGLLGKGMWDLNKDMTAANATIARQAQLSDMSAKNLYAWGEAARTVGANPQDVAGGIAGLQTAVMGMGIGAGDATGQLVALSRLGVRYDFRNGPDIDQLFAVVNQRAKERGFQGLGALRALTAPVMNQAMFDLATTPGLDPSQMHKQIEAMQPRNIADILQRSLKSQEVLGRLGISKDILEETAYGGEQGLMQAAVQLLTSILDGIMKLVDLIPHPANIPGAVVEGTQSLWKRMTNPKRSVNNAAVTHAMQTLMASGMSEDAAAAAVGNLMQESGVNPFARNASNHVGIAQWDQSRQAAFAKKYGYWMGSGGVSADKQLEDQLAFLMQELQTTESPAAAEMARMKSLIGKTGAFMNKYERPGDNSLDARYSNALMAKQMVDSFSSNLGGAQVTVSHDTTIGHVHVHTNATDARGIVADVRAEFARQPILNIQDQGVLSLSSRGMSN
jgi:hypothetical protein